MYEAQTSTQPRGAESPRASTRRPQRRRRLAAEDRRDQLVAAAMPLFAHRGFAGTTTAEIAKAAGVSEAIIFKHFAHKEELYEAILEQKARQAGTEKWVAELKTAQVSGEDLKVIARLMTLIMDHSRQDPEFLRLMFHAALDHRKLMREFRTRHLAPLYSELVRFVELGQRAGRFRADDPHVLARVLLAVPSYHAMLEGLLGGDSLAPLADDAMDVYARMLLDALSMPRTGRNTAQASSIQKRRRS